MKKFDEWSEAEDWAKETNRSLEPIGTCTGDERIVLSDKVGHTKVELFSRFAEVIAVGEHNEIYLNIKEYVVVTTDSHRYGDTDLYHADDLDDAMNEFADIVSQLRVNAVFA